MSDQAYWENGERVAAYDPRDEVEKPSAVDSPPVVFLRKLLGILHSDKNLPLAVGCLTRVVGLSCLNETVASIAEENAVTRATVYNRCHEFSEIFCLTQETLSNREVKTVRRLIGFLNGGPHPRLTLDSLCLITGICYDGLSMAEIGRKNKVSRATVSNRCVELAEAFGLDPTRAMRSRQARENCKKARFKKVSELIQ